MLRPWKMITAERIDVSRTTPIYVQIVHALIQDIQRGRLLPGTFLPSSRELAANLGVNRKTVVLAYEDLIAQGWLCSSGTRGTIVSTSLPETPLPGLPPSQTWDSVKAHFKFTPAPLRPLAIPAGRRLKLDGGAPDSRLFPGEILARAYRTAIRRASRHHQHQYRSPYGSERLRESIAAMLRSQRGLAVTTKNICITRGSQMGILLAMRILARPDDVVLVEELAYESAVAAIRACGANAVPVSLDEHGINVEDVERMCRKHRVRAVFLTPHHQFPTTVTLSPDRRMQLLALARQFSFAVIEDDYDHEFHFHSQPLLPMASYAPEHVIYVGSMSKLLLPALRVGYVAAPQRVIDSIAHEVSVTDGMGNTLTEDAVADLIDSGEVRRHVRKVAPIYAQRRDAFAQALQEEFGPLVDFRTPEGGLAFWLRFPDPNDLDRIEQHAPSLGVRFAPSRSFTTRDSAPRGLRVGFASLNPLEARQGLKDLRKAAGY